MFLAIFCLFVGLVCAKPLDTNVVYWACDELNGNPCFGIVQYENGQASPIPLSTTGFDLLRGFAIDSENGVGYLLLGDSSYNSSLFTVVTAKLTSGDVVSYSTGNTTLVNAEVLDVHFDAKSSQLIAFIKIPGNYNLYSIDIASGAMTLITNVYSSFTYNYFSSSVYNSPLFTAILVGPEGEMTSYLVDISTNKLTTNQPPYALGSLAIYDSSSNLLVGSTFDFPTLENQFVFYQPASGNYTLGNLFGVGDFCGASPHSAYDPTSQYYYTMCCQGAITGCLNATISTFQVTSGDNVAELDLAWEEQPAFGFYL